MVNFKTKRKVIVPDTKLSLWYGPFNIGEIVILKSPIFITSYSGMGTGVFPSKPW